MLYHNALAWRLLLLASLMTAVVLAEEEGEAKEVDEKTEVAAKEDNSTQPYKEPNTEGLHWVETFDGDALSRWVTSTKEKYNGKFEIAKRRREGLIGDVGLLVSEEAKHYGISASFPALKGDKAMPGSFALQFEVQFQDGLQCGGSYVKVFDRKDHKIADFDNDQQYIIMFGPDKCGGTNKVHFILQHQSPKTGKWEEKHLKDAPSVPDDKLTHLYGLVINGDNSFEVQIDGVKKASGDLLTAMEPPINPPKEIDDAADKLPGDWIHDAKMDDPASSKPEDWDEDEPYSIPDASAKIPDGWREDVEAGKIADPSAQMPADWDNEEDGEWEAPQVENPACTVGCGKWNPPTINNPKYKGKWSAPKIDNPQYKGVWKPRQIANPDFFEDQTPSVLPNIDSVGIDIWTMQGGILFDNFVIATDPTKVAAFADETWRIRSSLEELQKPKPSLGTSMWDTLSTYAIPIGITAAILLVTTIWCCCCQGVGESTPAPPARPAKKKRDESPKPTEAKDPAEDSEDDKKDKDSEDDKKD